MARITLYGVSKSIVQRIRGVLSGSLGDVLWKLLMISLLLLLGIVLAAMGPVGAVLGFIMLSTLFAEGVREAISDFYNRNWAELEVGR